MSIVSTDWTEKNLGKIKIIDCSWHMPQTKRDGLTEYKAQHIKNSIFFDLDNNSKKDSELPHMLVEINDLALLSIDEYGSLIVADASGNNYMIDD